RHYADFRSAAVRAAPHFRVAAVVLDQPFNAFICAAARALWSGSRDHRADCSSRHFGLQTVVEGLIRSWRRAFCWCDAHLQDGFGHGCASACLAVVGDKKWNFWTILRSV